MANASIKHVGILGMKWGVRKKSYKDSSDHVSARKLKGKKTSQLSNEDLKKLTARLQLERQLKDLKSQDVNAGKKWVGDILKESGKVVIVKYVSKGLTSVVEMAISAAMKNK
jgi:hypothetical protein